MNSLMRVVSSGAAGQSFSRLFHTSVTCSNRTRRIRLGLPETFRREPEMMESSDYSFLDGRPTPVGKAKSIRIEKQEKFGKKALKILGEIDYVLKRPEIKREQRRQKEEAILSRKLKPKGIMYKPKDGATENE